MLSKATVLRILYFLTFCCTAAWLPKFADYCLGKGLSHAQMSFVLSIPPVMMFAVQPLYGVMADKLGYKKTILISAFVASLSYLCYLFGDGFIWIAIITMVMAAFYNTLQPVLDSIALQLSKSDARFSYGTLRVFGSIGWAATSIITGYFIEAVDISVIFVVSATAMFFIFFAGFLLKDEEEVVTEKSFKNVKDVMRQPVLLYLLFCVFLISVGATTIWNFYSIYMKENGATDSLVGYGLSFQGLCELPLFYFASRIIFRFGLRTTFVLTALATAVRMFLYSVTKNPNAAIPIELLHGLSWSLFWVVCVEFVNKLVDEKWRATGQSLLYASYFGAGQIAGNYWTEFFVNRGMKISEVFLINAGLALGALLLFALLVKKESPRHSSS